MGLDRADQDQAFMAGMFSMLGILFGTPLPELIRPLQLSEVLVAAIFDQQGDIGRLLELQACADQCDAPALSAQLSALHLTPAQFTLASLAACQWMLNIVHDVKGVGQDG